MPHSYGASLASVGRRGASSREAPKLRMPNTTASPASSTIGRYWPTSGPPPRVAHRGATGWSTSGRFADRTAGARFARSSLVGRYRQRGSVGGDEAVAAVQQPAQREEDDRAADGEHRGRLSASAEV